MFAFHIGGYSNELSILILSIILGLLHLGGQAFISDIERGLKWALGPRDETKPLSVIGARFERASKNYFETFPLFAAILIIIEFTGRSNELTRGLANLWFVARIIYYPAYVLGWPIRSWVWMVALLAIIAGALALFWI